jgi:glutamine amidotransferase
MIAIIDYGVGNIFSLSSSLKKLGIDSVVTSDKNVIRSANSLILPGVGAFGDAIDKLNECNLKEEIVNEAKNGKPLLGICLGMQLLFDKSYEYGTHEGLKLIKGDVVPLRGEIENLKIPHMGWNSLDIKDQSKLFKYIKNGDYVYFVHSYYAKCNKENIIATSKYGIDVTAAVSYENVYGTQFHPEKSGDVGLNILKAFAEIK